MPRRRGPDRRRGDGLYQLPIVDLVAQTDPVAQQAQQELDELGQLLQFSAEITSEVLDRARLLLELIESLEASGLCPESLHNNSRAFFLSLGLHTALSPGAILDAAPGARDSGDNNRGEGVGVGGNDDHDHIINHDHDGEIISHNGGVQRGPESPTCRIAQVLEGLGFRDPQTILHKYGSQAVQKALDRLNSRPSGSVANRGAYLRALLNEVQP